MRARARLLADMARRPGACEKRRVARYGLGSQKSDLRRTMRWKRLPFILGERNTSQQGAHDGHGRYAEVGPVGPMVGGALHGLVSGCTQVTTLGDGGGPAAG